MARRRAKKSSKSSPRFPRRRWQPGQSERTAKPKKGGGYDRTRERRAAEEEKKTLKDKS